MLFRSHPGWSARGLAAAGGQEANGQGSAAAGAAQAARPEPLELPTALWTLTTYLALGWLPPLLGGLR